jgi:hypothetical protein
MSTPSKFSKSAKQMTSTERESENVRRMQEVIDTLQVARDTAASKIKPPAKDDEKTNHAG